jgi:adsorption protein B
MPLEIHLLAFFDTIAAITVVGVFIFAVDDLFIDLVALIKRLRPSRLSAESLLRMQLQPQKTIAVLIANWKEFEVIEKMVAGNVARIRYEKYSFFLGVYPNDTETWAAARRVEEKFPNVFVVVNSKPGPTSKGQMLNEMVRQILASEKITHINHDLFVLQDSEDLIHPLAFLLMNQASDSSDFVQLPVFSLSNPRRHLVAGTYIDEFAESHTKDMLVRHHLGAPVPSAGVGTAISRRLVLALTDLQGGDFLDPHSLTEDYQLGHTAARLGFRTSFHCLYTEQQGKKDFIATREYFPDGFWQSIRQKTRWTVGIAYQGRDALGWSGNLVEKYFFWRDRRSPWNAALLLSSLGLLIAFSGTYAVTDSLPTIAGTEWFAYLCALNLAQTCLRVASRMLAVTRVYGLVESLMVPLRWPVANVVNTWSAFRATDVYRTNLRNGTRPKWVKTEHRLPEGFGVEAELPAPRQPARTTPAEQEVRA